MFVHMTDHVASAYNFPHHILAILL